MTIAKDKTYIVAVSGGVDSMVLLDKMMQLVPAVNIVVAHFDHGIRADSNEDALFVADVAKKYGLKFEHKREELGVNASEAQARERRYVFLNDVAKKHRATIVTAHHLDDLIETVAINIVRGTGWRGLAVFSSNNIERPLLNVEKREILDYAREHNIKWREDSTNATDKYLRNRLRQKTINLPLYAKREIAALYVRQKEIRQQVDVETEKIINNNGPYSRHFFIQIPQSVAVEYLYAITRGNLTRPQLQKTLHAIKVAKPNTIFQAGNGIHFNFTTRHFSL